MNQLKPTSAQSFSGHNGGFASALAETKNGGGSPTEQTQDPFLQALMDSGNGSTPEQQLQRQREFLQKRNKLHQEVNPPDQTEIFAARAEKNQKDIAALRAQLRANYSAAVQETPEIDQNLQANIPQGETTGFASYINAYISHIQSELAKITKYISSAKDSGAWAATAKGKKAKGLGKGGHQTTKAVWDMGHHENAVSTQGAG